MNWQNTPRDEPYNSEVSDLTLFDLFYGDKSGWYEEKDGKMVWAKSYELNILFWRAVRREKILMEDFDFSAFVFPQFFEDSFWSTKERREFKGYANFKKTTFMGVADFSKVAFLESADFKGAIFSDAAYFDIVKFSGDANFESINFSRGAGFESTTFSGKSVFSNTTFSGDAYFRFSSFLKDAFFWFSTISGVANFGLVKFLGEVSFNRTSINSALFEDTYFSSDSRCLFKEWKIGEGKKDSYLDRVISFRDVIFPDTVQFQRCNMNDVQFQSCDFVKVNFSNCKFPRSKNRIVLANDNDRDYGDIANMYRQMKLNRMNAKDWRDAGDAYRSEMVITQRQLWQEFKEGQLLKYFNWLIMALHGGLSGYQQSMTRPLAWLFGLWLVVPVILFFSDYGVYESMGIKIWEATKTSFDAALPLAGKIDLKQYDRAVYFLLLFERVLSIVLLTFFGLATRARLRQ